MEVLLLSLFLMSPWLVLSLLTGLLEELGVFGEPEADLPEGEGENLGA